MDTASQPYAVTLWTFLQEEERQRLDSLIVKRRQIDAAYMMGVAINAGTSKLSVFENQLRAEFTRPIDVEATREELSRRADELYAQHEAAKRGLH